MSRSAASDLIRTIENMDDSELVRLRAAIEGRPMSATSKPKRAYDEEVMDPMGVS